MTQTSQHCKPVLACLENKKADSPEKGTNSLEFL
jgi:hypothetical protein